MYSDYTRPLLFYHDFLTAYESMKNYGMDMSRYRCRKVECVLGLTELEKHPEFLQCSLFIYLFVCL